MDNGNELVRAIIDKKIRESLLAQQKQHSDSSIIDKIQNLGNRAGEVGEGMSAVGEYLANNTSLGSLGAKSQAIGGALQKGAGAISSIGSVGNAIGSGATAGATAGASATGGATATSSAMGGAMSNPVTALIALGIMALNGSNRHRAEKTGQQAEQLANNQIDIAKSNLSQVPQNSIGATDIVSAPIPQNATSDDIKKSAFGGIANGLDDFLSGYKENKTQNFDWNNLKSDNTKSFMNRLGEGVGTVAKVSQNPIVQGVIAGGLSGLFSGDPLYGLSSAYKYANGKYKANLYKDILAQQGLDVGNNNGIIDADDLSKILTSRKYQKDYMSRGEYDKFRLDNGQLTVDEYNALISNPDYKSDEILNITGLGQISKAGKYAQDNKNSRSQNYWRNKNEGKNVIKVEYGEKPDTHNYTHVTYGNKPESKNTTYVKYENKPQYSSYKPKTTPQKPQSSERVKVISKDNKIGTIPKSQLTDALKQGYRLYKNGKK